MANIFTLENVTDFSEKINIDDLYERKRQADLNQLALFNKILNRIHVKIKTVARCNKNEHHSWFIVPEIIIGVPKYDQGACIGYLMDKLTENKFLVQYFHPNAILISWNHWVPSYVRTEYKKKTGIVIDEFGKKVEEKGISETEENPKNLDGLMFNSTKGTKPVQPPKKNYTPVESYKPTGNLVYDDEYLSKIQDKFS